MLESNLESQHQRAPTPTSCRLYVHLIHLRRSNQWLAEPKDEQELEMAVNESRSMNDDLHKGLNDGRLKSLTPGRGGSVETANVVNRQNLLQAQYNIVDFMMSKAVKSDNDYNSGYTGY
jgi:hypothetical protein